MTQDVESVLQGFAQARKNETIADLQQMLRNPDDWSFVSERVEDEYAQVVLACGRWRLTLGRLESEPN